MRSTVLPLRNDLGLVDVGGVAGGIGIFVPSPSDASKHAVPDNVTLSSSPVGNLSSPTLLPLLGDCMVTVDEVLPRLVIPSPTLSVLSASKASKRWIVLERRRMD